MFWHEHEIVQLIAALVAIVKESFEKQLSKLMSLEKRSAPPR
jgi:hypothetical protein